MLLNIGKMIPCLKYCVTRSDLLDAVTAATLKHSELLSILHTSPHSQEHELQHLEAAVETARMKAANIQKALHTHRFVHGC